VLSNGRPRGSAREAARRVDVANKATTAMLVPQAVQGWWGIEMEGLAWTRGGGDKPSNGHNIGESRKRGEAGDPTAQAGKKTDNVEGDGKRRYSTNTST